MKLEFYIDRYFGHLIWINVEDGIITEFPHIGKMEDKLNERYKGYPIAQFKREFESQMKPSWYCVKCDKYSHLLRQEDSLEGQISYWTAMQHNINYKKDDCIAKVKELKNELYQIRVDKSAMKMILTEQFNYPV